MTDWAEIEFFTKEEFSCPCCGVADMNMAFIAKLDRMRRAAGFPMIVTSGYRCPDYNDKISSTGRDGPHTTGKAADLAVSFHRARRLLDFAPQYFAGIGLKQHGEASGRFIHVDDLQRRMWTYG